MNQDMSATTDVRRFGYYIPKLGGTVDFIVHKAASADVLTEFHEICSVISNLQPIIFAFDIVERNFRELVDSIEEHRSQLNNSVTANAGLIPVDMSGFVLVAQKVSNFLSSAGAFLTQTEIQLGSVHGKESPELKTWNTKRNDQHAACFSYRFLYELRNFSQHRSLPFSSLNIAGERASENAPMHFKTSALISRDGLFGVGYDWKKSVEAEIRKQPSEFELQPLIAEYLHSLRQLCLEAVKLQGARLAECARYFDAVLRTLKIPMGAVPVIFIGESSSKKIPPSRLEIIPIEQFKYLLREYDKLLNTCELV